MLFQLLPQQRSVEFHVIMENLLEAIASSTHVHMCDEETQVCCEQRPRRLPYSDVEQCMSVPARKEHLSM